jgi:hypothetical protein
MSQPIRNYHCRRDYSDMHDCDNGVCIQLFAGTSTFPRPGGKDPSKNNFDIERPFAAHPLLARRVDNRYNGSYTLGSGVPSIGHVGTHFCCIESGYLALRRSVLGVWAWLRSEK